MSNSTSTSGSSSATSPASSSTSTPAASTSKSAALTNVHFGPGGVMMGVVTVVGVVVGAGLVL